MTRTTRRAALPLLAFLVSGPAAAQSPVALWDEARFAWDAGDYPTALRAQLALLAGPAAADYLPRVALLTGERYEVREVAPDGRGVRWSPDGRWLVYETAADGEVTTHVLAASPAGRGQAAEGAGSADLGPRVGGVPAAALPRAASLPGAGMAFSADGARYAYIDRSGRVRTGATDWAGDRAVELGGLTALEVAPGADALYLIATESRGAPQNFIYEIREGAAPRRLSAEPAERLRLQVLPRGQLLVLVREPRPDVPGRPAPTRFELIDPSTSVVRQYHGTAPAVSDDGSTLVHLASSDGRNRVDVIDLSTWESRGVLETDSPLASLALSRDGRTIVLQQMPVDDWELYVMSAVDGESRRLTREIQHDIFPRFAGDAVLGVKGEARHRRSYLYDPLTGEGERLFHNNTVRTIAPEYEWAVSPDGRRVLVVAERDGDTVSLERGVYLVDLDRPVTAEAVDARLRAMLAAEEALRSRAAEMYAPIADVVRERTAAISLPRLYDSQRALYGFGSKYITQPGNQAASAHLFETLRAFGYEPEYQWFEATDRRSGETVRTANVIATLPGTVDPDLVYVVSSHFDSVERGPGADDNTSGTSVLLETARVLAGHPLPTTVQLAFFTGEEAGLLGSREYVRRAVEDSVRIVGALNNDMIGWSGDHRLDNTIRYSNPGIRDLQHAAALLFSELITYDALYYKNTDAHAYYEVYGDIVGGIGSYPVLANPHYHQLTDQLETINQELVRETARTNLASLMLLASSPSRLAGLEVAESEAGLEARWSASPESDVVAYEVVYGPPTDPAAHQVRVREPRASLRGAAPGWSVAVRAVNARGLAGWDWARH